ncbi:MAG: VWA domain-containing protein [Thermoanaerobaculia bacterium]|nr:VWA domain-containing protein [Thermoanaerobaculia bacterium]
MAAVPRARQALRPRRCAARPRRWAAVVGCWLAACGAADAQLPHFAERETVVAVEIPVNVTVDGRPVSGLRAEDFEVLEGRRRQPIVGFDVVDLAVANVAASSRPIDPALPPAARRYFLLLFDLTNVEPAAVVRARRAAQQLVADSLLPTDLVAVATWSLSRGATLQLGFTSDRSQVQMALETLGLAVGSPRRDPLGILLADIERSAPGAAPRRRSESQAADRRDAEADDVLLAHLQRLASQERASLRGQRAYEATAFTEGLASLARMLASIQGRKQVVLLSRGFDESLLLGAADPAQEELASSAAASGEIWQIDSEARFGDSRVGNALARSIAELRRADCAIQAVDVAGLAVDAAGGEAPRSAGRGTLLTLARDTGGELYANFNRLGEAMARLLESTRVTYVLTILPRGLQPDGRYHELRVRLRRAPAGTRLQHRPGYFAPRPFEQRPEIARQIESAQLLLTGMPGGELAAGVVAPVFRTAGELAHVPVVIEMEGRALLGVGARQPRLPVAVYAYAFDGEGAVSDFAAQSVQLELGEVEPRLRREPIKFVGDLLLPAGHYTLRTLVRVGESGSYFLGHSEIAVAPTTGELQVVAPLAAEPMERGLVVRLTAGREQAETLPFPFVSRGEYFLPSGRPRFRAGQPLELALNVYGLAAGSAEIRGELVGADGRRASDVAIFVTSDAVAADGGLRRFTLSAAPGNPTPGAYTLRLAVHQGARSATVESPIAVER